MIYLLLCRGPDVLFPTRREPFSPFTKGYRSPLHAQLFTSLSPVLRTAFTPAREPRVGGYRRRA